jgi:hypothetical protein
MFITLSSKTERVIWKRPIMFPSRITQSADISVCVIPRKRRSEMGVK